MSVFPVHTIQSAPEGSKALLRGLQQSLGMIPNLAACMAESPELLRGFLGLREVFYGGTFLPAEAQVLALSNALENECRYCMALHSAFALQAGAPPEAVEALRQGRRPTDPRLGALSDFSRELVRGRGRVEPGALAELLAAGFSRAQALEVVLGVGVSILPNFSHHLTGCPVDAAFAAHAWSPARAAQDGLDDTRGP